MKRRKGLDSRRSSAWIARRKAAVAEALERDGHRCQALDVWPHECAGGLVGHEPLTRARGGDPCNPDHVLTVCDKAHRHLHAHPAWAADVGLLRHAWEAS